MEVAYNEFKLLKNLEHPNIIKMREAYLNELKETMYLVMDMAKGETLQELVDNKALSEDD
jgi:serine/threonine protein kinase